MARCVHRPEIMHAHHDLESQFGRVHAAAKAGDWRECNALWSSFEQAVVEHIAHQEEHLFPAYRQKDAAAAADERRLVTEHNAILEQVEHLGDELQIHHSTAGITEMLALLRSHTAAENALFHPWLNTRANDNSQEQP